MRRCLMHRCSLQEHVFSELQCLLRMRRSLQEYYFSIALAPVLAACRKLNAQLTTPQEQLVLVSSSRREALRLWMLGVHVAMPGSTFEGMNEEGTREPSITSFLAIAMTANALFERTLCIRLVALSVMLARTGSWRVESS